MANNKVELLDTMGDDLKVVNMARVSFAKESSWVYKETGRKLDAAGSMDYDTVRTLGHNDISLIKFLARGVSDKEYKKRLSGPMNKELYSEIANTSRHEMPFAHCAATFRIEAPIFVARQLAKHQVGMVWSEVSRRYVDTTPTWDMLSFRGRAPNKKQGSGNEIHSNALDLAYESYMSWSLSIYEAMLKVGVCPEQARAALPQGVNTQWVWTGSLLAWSRVHRLRTSKEAQQETRDIVQEIGTFMGEKFPVSWQALTE